MSVKNIPTLYAANPFSPADDAASLRKALKGAGTDEKTIIEILGRRSTNQRLEIAAVFKHEYGKELFNELKSDLSGNFEATVTALMIPRVQFYAKELHNAITGLKTDKEAIVDILYTVSNAGIKKIAETYVHLYGKSLEEHMKSATKDHFQRLCLKLLQGTRDESTVINQKSAAADASALFNIPKGQWGKEDSLFITVLGSKSDQQLFQIFTEYEHIAAQDIETTIKREFKGSLDAYTAIIKCVKSKVDYFSERLHWSMAGLGTSDKTLIRIIVSRCEVDLETIKGVYEKKFGKSLAHWIKGDTSGDYRTMLLTLIGEKN